jgi:hypothetical protein
MSVPLMRPCHAYTPKLIFHIFPFFIDSFRNPSDIVPAPFHHIWLLNNVPTASHLCYDFHASQKTFAHLRALSHIFPHLWKSLPIQFLHCLSALLPLFARTSASVLATHRTYSSTVKINKYTFIYPSDFIPIHSYIRTCHKYGKPTLRS